MSRAVADPRENTVRRVRRADQLQPGDRVLDHGLVSHVITSGDLVAIEWDSGDVSHHTPETRFRTGPDT